MHDARRTPRRSRIPLLLAAFLGAAVSAAAWDGASERELRYRHLAFESYRYDAEVGVLTLDWPRELEVSELVLAADLEPVLRIRPGRPFPFRPEISGPQADRWDVLGLYREPSGALHRFRTPLVHARCGRLFPAPADAPRAPACGWSPGTPVPLNSVTISNDCLGEDANGDAMDGTPVEVTCDGDRVEGKTTDVEAQCSQTETVRGKGGGTETVTRVRTERCDLAEGGKAVSKNDEKKGGSDSGAGGTGGDDGDAATPEEG